MNILFTLAEPFNPLKGGVGRVTDTLCKAFQEKGHVTYFLHLIRENEAYPYSAPTYYFPNTDINSTENTTFYWHFLKEHKIDIIINQAGEWEDSKLFLNTGSLTIPRISCFHSRPLRDFDKAISYFSCDRKVNKIVNYLRCTIKVIAYPYLSYKNIRTIKQHFEYLSKHNDKIVLLSFQFIPQISHWSKIDLNKFTSIPNPNTFSPIPFIETKKKQILYVGRLSKAEKQPERLLKVWREIYKKFPDWELIFCGDGPDRLILEEKAHSLDRVRFVGFQNPTDYYQNATILCMTSNYEGWGMVITECMQYSMIPITFNSYESAEEIIQDGVNGFLVQPYDLNQYRQKLSFIMSLTENERKIIRLNAHESISKYNIENVIVQWQTLLDELIHKHS